MLIVMFVLWICAVFPVLPFIVTHIDKVVHWGIHDIYLYFKHKRYNECRDFGRVITICADGSSVFGSGKTLSGVHSLRFLYEKYDGLEVWNPSEERFVTQHIHIVSNVELTDIPYTPFTNEKQLIEVEQPEMDVTFFFLDEASTIWNSRNYKDNISHELLTNLLQCRKNKIALITTSQRFIFQDKLIREITSVVWQAKKMWRIQQLKTYDAFAMENCANPMLLKPLATSFWFIKDDDFAAYDTNAVVERLKKKNEEGGFISNAEILEGQGAREDVLEMVAGLSKKGRKRIK
jgi:hypothetical protein